jgi:hypothetical protein
MFACDIAPKVSPLVDRTAANIRLPRAINGPLREDRSPPARKLGITACGGRNFQRTHGDDAERRSAELWSAAS